MLGEAVNGHLMIDEVRGTNVTILEDPMGNTSIACLDGLLGVGSTGTIAMAIAIVVMTATSVENVKLLTLHGLKGLEGPLAWSDVKVNLFFIGGKHNAPEKRVCINRGAIFGEHTLLEAVLRRRVGKVALNDLSNANVLLATHTRALEPLSEL
jgi:hypothetical protein